MKDVQAYIARQPAPARKILKRIRQDIRAVAPRATEVFSYGIPGFRLDGKPFVWFAGFRNHLSLYPLGPKIQRAHAAALEGCGFSKGTIRFPLEKPPSSALVRKLVRARLADMR